MRWDGYRRAFIHVGTHKTGTTALQMLFAANAAALAGAGFLFPRTGRPLNLFGTDVAGHHNLPWHFLADGRYDPRDGSIAELVAEIEREGLPIVVLSSEDFALSLERPQGLADLRDALERLHYRTSAIVYLRPQRGYLHALYTELGRQGLALGFEEFLMHVMLHGEYRVGIYVMPFDYRRLLEPLVACFGPERTIVRGYRPGAPDDVLPRDFLAVISSGLPLEYERLAPIARENAAASYADVLRAQYRNFSKGRGDPENVYAFAREALGAEADRLLAAPFAPLGPGEDAAFSARFAASNAEIASRFGCRLGEDPPAVEQREQRRFLERAVLRWAQDFGS